MERRRRTQPAAAEAPPHNADAERALLGALLYDPTGADASIEWVRERLAVDDLYVEIHRVIYRAMLDLAESGRVVDLPGILPLVMGAPAARGAAVAFYLTNDLTNPGEVGDRLIPEQVRRILDCAVRRRLLDVAAQLRIEAGDYSTPAETACERASALLLEVGDRSTVSGERTGLRPIGETMRKVFTRLESATEGDGKPPGLQTGFTDLDALMVGMNPGELVIVAGRPGTGKSALIVNIAVELAVRRSVPSAVFSLEMTAEELVLRALASEARVDSQRLKTPKILHDEEWRRLVAAASPLSNAPITIDDQGSLAIGTIWSRARAWRRKIGDGPAMLAVDYLQLAEGPEGARTDEARVSAVSRALKAIAKSLNLVVISLAQLNRDCDSREDKRPTKRDLRSSGQIEQDADKILLLYRDELYNKDTEEPGVCEVNLDKHRGGPVGVVKLKWIGHHTRFENYTTPNPGNRPWLNTGR